VWVTSSLTTALTPTAVALGNFDGIHQGHQQVIRPVLEATVARIRRMANPPSGNCHERQTSAELPALSSEPAYATVVTFHPHPKEFFSGKSRTLLTPLDEKIQTLRSLGVEQLVLLPFDRELAALTPQAFVEEILVKQLRSQLISVGADFHFGCKRSGTATDLQQLAAQYGIQVKIVPLENIDGDRISSSIIRQALIEGDIQRANRLLDRAYQLTGKIVQGQQLGRTIGFPTANLDVAWDKFLPRQGVYAVWAQSTAFENSQQRLKAVMNIGTRPTVSGTRSTIEVHLINWTGDLYGQTLTVSLQQFLRAEQRFASLEALKAQIQADCDRAKSLLI
jgi:riboflavin kinase / FMN adenylyltransferase